MEAKNRAGARRARGKVNRAKTSIQKERIRRRGRAFSKQQAKTLEQVMELLDQLCPELRRLHEIPALRLAMRQGRLSYEKARLVAGCAGDTTVNDWIERAEKVTCIALKREIESLEQKQICARGELDQRVPKRVASLLDATFRAAREIEGRWLSPGECLVRVAEHFISVWNEALCERRTPQKRVLERDRGWVRVRGCAPDGLFWELGVRPGGTPLDGPCGKPQGIPAVIFPADDSCSKGAANGSRSAPTATCSGSSTGAT